MGNRLPTWLVRARFHQRTTPVQSGIRNRRKLYRRCAQRDRHDCHVLHVLVPTGFESQRTNVLRKLPGRAHCPGPVPFLEDLVEELEDVGQGRRHECHRRYQKRQSRNGGRERKKRVDESSSSVHLDLGA